jgi:hypothetical protein
MPLRFVAQADINTPQLPSLGQSDDELQPSQYARPVPDIKAIGSMKFKLSYTHTTMLKEDAPAS